MTAGTFSVCSIHVKRDGRLPSAQPPLLMFNASDSFCPLAFSSRMPHLAGFRLGLLLHLHVAL